jgi:hypothetical protein
VGAFTPAIATGRGPVAVPREPLNLHNVGELQLNVTNFNILGSAPGSNATFAEAPSAMWPAGSGVDYLFAASLWVGAMKNGVPLVSAGTEIRSNADDPLDTIWVSAQGNPGGARYPDPSFDDDGDGASNEDPLNGLDDDGDDEIDEDFAAVSNQYFRCVMRDDTAPAREQFPDHEPLDIEVVQESFAWENNAVDDFIGLQYTVTNAGVHSLQDVFVGLYADADIGPRGGQAISQDDLPYFIDEEFVAKDGSLVPITVACMYDADLDGGVSPGVLGIMFLNHDTDPTGETAPASVTIRSFQTFARGVPFDSGGDPTNDAEAYELLSRADIDTAPAWGTVARANDFRILLANGPFQDLEVGESLTFQMAIVLGDGLVGLRTNAAEAALTYYGGYFDRDGDPDTGVLGRETRICAQDFGPLGPANPIFSIFQDCCDSITAAESCLPIDSTDLDADGCIFINGDCEYEARRGATDCKATDVTKLAGCTGVLGNEYQVPWLVGLAPVAPTMRVESRDGHVVISWNSLSQIVPDVRLQKIDFESYRVWRADGWDRPFGTSVENGPESDLWSLIAEFDRVDSYRDERRVSGGETTAQELPLGANTGFDSIRYVPAVLRASSPEQDRYAPLAELVARIVRERPELGPTTDPSTVLRYRDARGTVTELGRAYPELEAWECCETQLDTLFYDAVGVEFYRYEDPSVHNGIQYFYAVTATDFEATVEGDELVPVGPGLAGDPQTNFAFAVPRPEAQTAEERARLGSNVYVVPNPATREALAEFGQLHPNTEDPTGVRVMFANLPRARNTVRVFTVSGDLVQTIEHDGRDGDGAAFWNLVSRNGQEVVSGIYLYSVESSDPGFDRVVGRFVVVR